MRIAPLLGVSVLVALTIAGCGTQSASGPGTSVAPSSPAGGQGGTALTITVLADADADADADAADVEPQTWTLTCDPVGGTHPDPEAACAALTALDDPFKPVDASMACTQIYGGPQTATVTGTYEGRPVDAAFSRTDGCQIARWDALQPLLVIQGGA